MKAVLISLFTGILMVGCYSRDDSFERTVRLQIQDAITLDNKETYSVGDTIFFEVRFSRYLKEEGFSSLLDVYETTDEKQFLYSFGLSKYSDFSNRYESVVIDPELILGSRFDNSNSWGSFLSGDMVVELNDTQDFYESRVGIVLVETGDFQLNLDFLTFGTNYFNDEVQLAIEHSFSNDSPLNTEFTVVE